MSRIFTGPVPRTLAAIRAAGLDADTILRDGMTAETYQSRAMSATGGWMRDPNDPDSLLELKTLWPTPEIGAEIFAIYVDEITRPATEDEQFWAKVEGHFPESSEPQRSTPPGTLGIVAIVGIPVGLVVACFLIAALIGGGS